MIKILKKSLAMLLAVAMVFGAAPLSGFVGLDLPEFSGLKKMADSVSAFFEGVSIRAEAVTYSGVCGDNLTWTFDTDTGELVISGTGGMTDYWIDSPWSDYKEMITEVTIEDDVTNIGNYAFYKCTNLEKIVIPSGVENIGSYAFGGCAGLKSVIIPDSVVTIEGNSFRDCSALTDVIIPDSVTAIGSQVFYECRALKSITVDEKNLYYSSDEYGVLFNKQKTTLIMYPIGNERTKYTIPDSVLKIEGSAFRGCAGLVEIIVPDNVMNIGDFAFYGCNIKRAKISDSVTYLGENLFMNCYRLSVVVIPDSVKNVQADAFEGCRNLTDVCYYGSEEEWSEITTEEGNEYLSRSVFHYNYVPSDDVFDFFEFSQLHTVNNYLSKNSNYNSRYFGGKAVSLDGSNGMPDMCIPGLSKNDDMIPQGITYYKDKNWLLISAYSSKENNEKNRPSVVYALDFNTGEYVAEFKIYNSDLTPYKKHVGGIAVSKECLFIADNECKIQYIPLEQLDVERGTSKSLIIKDYCDCGIYLNNAPISYLSYSNGYLWLGNFYHTDEQYDYPASESNNSLVVGIKLSAIGAEWDNIKDLNGYIRRPMYTYKLPNSISKIQGVVGLPYENTLFLFSSHGRTNESDIYRIDTASLNNVREDFGVIVIDESAVVSQTAFSMLQGAFVSGDYIYTLSESAAYYYNGYKPTYVSENPTDVVWRFKYNELLKSDTPVVEDVYNIGEETYSFKNFIDSDSQGHCFGMSVTSAGYHTGELDIGIIGGNSSTDLYSFSDTKAVLKPICHYQAIQGSCFLNSVVAGGRNYQYINFLLGISDVEADWDEVVKYVKNHKYDGKGSLQICFRKKFVGGHAVNFLRYAVVDGQERIYVYDNNFPETETYLYKDKNGRIFQAPKGTFSGEVDCVALCDISKYFGNAESFDVTHAVYANSSAINIEGIPVYPINCGAESGEWVMFEIPANIEQVTITPLVDNAEFIYIDEKYSFGDVGEDTVGILKLATAGEGSEEKTEMMIVNKSEVSNVSIRTPSTTTISYGDSLILHADVTGTLPEGATIQWTADNANFGKVASNDGRSCEITPKSSGDTTFTATVVGANGEVLAEDTQKMTSKASLWDKIVAFFKGIFGLTKTIPQIFRGVF